MWMIMRVDSDSTLLRRLTQIHPTLRKPYKSEEEALEARETFLKEVEANTYMREHLKVVRLI